MSDEATKIKYPKWVDHPSETVGKTKAGKDIPHRVLVQNEEEEKELLGKAWGDKSEKKKEDK